MIDFENLQPLPVKRQKDKLDRERLAEIAHRKRAAKHAGRNHWKNWERRKMAEEAKRLGKAKSDKRAQKFAGYIDAVRRFWAGEIQEHPKKP